jgi:hypothetical protein
VHRVKEEKNVLHTVKREEVNCIGCILRRNCLLRQIIEGKIDGRTEVTGRRGRRHKQLLYELKEMRGYWTLKAGALDTTQWGTRCGREYGPVVKTDYEPNENDIVPYKLRRVPFENIKKNKKVSCSPSQTT